MPKTVLIVDDHAAFRRFARRLVETTGFTVAGEAGDGASALALARALRPDVVLLDVLLPDTTGFAVAAELAAEPRRPRVVLTSSRTAAELAPLIRAEHAVGFLAKDELTAPALAQLFGGAA